MTAASRAPVLRDRRPWLWIGFGGLLTFCLFFLVRPFLDPGDAYRPRLIPGITYAYSFLVVAAFVPYAVAAWASRSGVSLRVAAVAGGLLHLIVLLAPLTQSQDLYAYLFYGKMWAIHGANPYTVLPLTLASDAWFPWMQWGDQVSVYGPLWTLITGGVARLAGGSLAAGYALMKAIVLVVGVIAVLGIARVAEDRGRPPGREVLLALWNPLVIVSLPLGGHADVAIVAAMVWAVAADRRGHSLLATLALTVAWLVKAYAVIVLLVYLLALVRRRVRTTIAAAGLASGVTILAWLPFWDGLRTLMGLGEVAGQVSASLGGQIQLLLGGLVGKDAAGLTVRILGVAIVAGVILSFARRRSFSEDPWPAAAAGFLAYVAVTPWFLYWHLAGPLALAAVAGTPAVRAAAYTFGGTAMLTASFGSRPWGRFLQTTLRYAPPALAGLRAAKRSGTGGTPQRSLPRQRSSA